MTEKRYMAPMQAGAFPVGITEAVSLGVVDIVLGSTPAQQEREHQYVTILLFCTPFFGRATGIQSKFSEKMLITKQ